jgi:hypothetical protein
MVASSLKECFVLFALSLLHKDLNGACNGLSAKRVMHRTHNLPLKSRTPFFQLHRGRLFSAKACNYMKMLK